MRECVGGWGESLVRYGSRQRGVLERKSVFDAAVITLVLLEGVGGLAYLRARVDWPHLAVRL